MAIFSPQQIKFEFLSYIKEFGGQPNEWRCGCAADAATVLELERTVDTGRDPWIWKPALSPAAARLVHSYFVNNLKAQDHETAATGSQVFLFRPRVAEAARDAAPAEAHAPGVHQTEFLQPASFVQRKSNTSPNFLG